MLSGAGFCPLFDLGKVSTSIHSIGFNFLTRAILMTSSTFLTGIISISPKIFFGISTKSFSSVVKPTALSWKYIYDHFWIS